MENLLFIFFVLSQAILYIGCNNESKFSESQELLDIYLTDAELSKATKVLVLTNFGCIPCNKAVEQVVDSFLNDSTHFVISTYHLQPNLSNVKWDSSAFVEQNNTGFLNSVLFTMENGEIEESIEIAPTNMDSFLQLIN